MIELKPELAEAYANRGHAYNNRDQYDRAIEDFSKAIEIKPDLGKAYLGRSAAYIEKGDMQRARKDFMEAFKLDPGAFDALREIPAGP